MTGAQARDLCRSLFLETVATLQVAPRMRSLMRVEDRVLRIGPDSYSLSPLQTVRIVSVGKASTEMAETAAEILTNWEQGKDTKFQGIVVSPESGAVQAGPLPDGRGSDHIRSGFQYFKAGHPYPDEQSEKAADAVLALLEKTIPGDVVLFLISGGGSALLEKPIGSSAAPPISIEDMRRFHELLVTSGASIQEINILRKHLSAVKGGRLAQSAASAAPAGPPAQVTLYVSDVPDHLPSAVASGPTMPDESTLADCLRIAARYHLLEKFPQRIRAFLESQDAPETPKPGDACFAHSRFYCLLSNRDGVGKLRELARSRGIRTAEESCDEWPVERAANYLLERLEALRERYPGEPSLLVSGGELSCPVPRGALGRGGRNQAFVLDCVAKIDGKPVAVLSAGTDGIDGNSPAAGAVADGDSARRAAGLGLDPQEFQRRYDSYGFFEKLNDAIVTGPTGTNVRDLRMLLAYS
jgi:glycerate 2-kinase